MKILTATVLLLATALTGCGHRPSEAKCFSYVDDGGPCSFTPVGATPWEVLNDEAG